MRGVEAEMTEIKKLDVRVQKARNGKDYLQIMSEDMVAVNIVLIADKIEVKDQRGEG